MKTEEAIKWVDDRMCFGCYCPICGRPIKTSGYVFDDDFVESEVEE